MIKSIDFVFNGTTTAITSYNSSVTNLGSLIRQYSGASNSDIFAGPKKIGLARPMEASTQIPSIYPHVITVDDTYDYVYLIDNATAAATRRIVLYQYDKQNSSYTWLGFITLTFPPTTSHTVRGFRMVNEFYTAGTVTVTTTSVTGSGTGWSTDGMCIGSRIGFGSTDPNQISTWYEISAIGSNTSITLTSSAGSVGAGSSYVIQDLRAVVTTTNATVTNGGLFIAKGLRPENFTSVGTTIPAAVSTDDIRAVYWLADAGTVTNTTAAGSALGERTSWTSQYVYVLNVTGAKVFVYNIRASLTLSSGKDTTAFVLGTGNQAVTGTLSQANNGRIDTLNHGPGSGITSLYFVTTTRVYRSALTSITSGNVTWQSDVMVEIPPGGTNTYLATSVLSSCEVASGIDRLLVMTTGAAGVRSYVTQYKTDSTPFDLIFLNDDKQLDQSTTDPGAVVHPAILALPFSVWSQGGILHLARIGTTAAQNQIYSLPINTHRTFAFDTNQLLVTPKFDVSDNTLLYKVSVLAIDELGTDTFSLPTEPYNIYYRTTGIDDNTGGWTLLDQAGDLSGVVASYIQFCFTFKVIGTTCIPARIHGLTITYEDSNTDSHYEPSVGESSVSNRIFAYRQAVLWNSNIPNMRIRIYNVSNGSLLLDDNVTASGYGTWEFSDDDGTTWYPWDNTQDVVGYYIRYTATSLPSGVRVRVLLTQ